MSTTPTVPLPEATPTAMADLAGLLTDRGVELRVTPAGELQLRDREKRLTPADRDLVRRYANDLADWLTLLAEPDEPAEEPTHPTIDPNAPRCDRCGSAEFIEVAIHGGASVRRDCARCRRTWGFPVWYGNEPDGPKRDT